ncbi:hypothetical protein LKO27_13870 [Tessaracoccus sp. OS52]|uniref:hypothetical protein n=1 Tax=Tessaracoccus sp. OS52 TaxID=2886691 RepID=UPI001D12D049|nr:hypothetical protein [Tessaracoccus sp. OS52]MCC2594492.1 hypothetical protein [Tessaracoccus sp. OS52]
MEYMGLFWFAFIALAVVAIFIIAYVTHQRNKKLWARWSKARNWVFHEKWPEMARTFRGGPFNTGSGRRASFGYEGTFDGLPVHGFNYQYSTGSGDDRRTHYFHVDVLRLGGRFPRLEIGRENWATRTFSGDIQFEDAQFNREWRIKGESPRFAHDVVHPRMMAWLQSGEVPEFSELWFENGCLLVATSGSRKPDEVDTYLRLLTRFASQLPPFLLAEVGLGRLPITWNGPGVTPEEQARRIAELAAQEEQG